MRLNIVKKFMVKIGIDISEGRIRIAKKRVKYYEDKLNINLNIEFY